ncbi:outer membrane protein assembly factor BamB family protein [Nonomuraea rhodomycinica]|uniref:PQQ-binding-like beta-propeller repeat protein n=1 Tax=Nonomuraea rhodomycinica TaxID=1712872 RepID=A0A7Y6IRZ4_9ACTN|nr:PQQ-binding-like beta-propeller repeat protein [Nonomuraea rhodomycinica]NUW42788.1 PQQ-binding-like beta-propeller repeat protein [Nonomuraea rhodomycinica]
MRDRAEARQGREVLTARRRRSAAILLVVVLATCSAAAVDDVTRPPRVPVEWHASWSVPADAGNGLMFLQAPGHAVSARAVAVATRQSTVRVHDPRTGALRRVIPADPARPAPVTGVWIAGDTLVVARGEPDGAEQTLYGHDLATGAPLWRRTAVTAPGRPRLGDTGSYHGPRILATERGVVVFERADEPLDIQALDARTGTTTARTTYPRDCRLTGAATARSVRLLSYCQGNELRLASIDPRTLRQEWTRLLPSSSSPAGGGPPIRLTANAEGYVKARAGADDFFLGPDGRLLSTGSQAVTVTDPDRWNPPLYAGSPTVANDQGRTLQHSTWPLPAYLISMDPGTGRLGGLPIDLPAHLVSLAGASRDMAFVFSDVPGDGRLTAYELIYGTARPATAWPDACGLLTARDLAAFADGYRPAPATDGAAKCDWIPPADDGAVVSLSVEWVSSSEAGARKLYTAEAAAVQETGDIDPTTEAPGFLSYTVAETNGFYGATIMNVGPVVVRLASSSRQAVRLLSPLLRDRLLARYQPGARAPAPAREPGWSFPTDAAVRTEPVVTGGVVYATSGDGTVSALDAATGAVRWRHRTGGSVEDGHVVAHGAVYAAGSVGGLVALDAGTGRPRWSRKLIVSGHLVVAAGRLYLWTRHPTWSLKAELVALDATSGKRLWSFEPAGDMLTPEPVLAGDVVLAGSDHGVVYALAPATGTERRRYRLGAEHDRILLLRAGATVYATSSSGDVNALDAVSGEVRWRSRITGTIASRPVVAGGTVYVGDDEGTTHALDAATGTPLWQVRAGGDQPMFTWRAAVAGGLLYTVGRDRTLYALDTATGRTRRRLPLPGGRGSGPVAADGTIHVSDREGTLYTLDAATGTVRSRFRTGGTAQTDPVVADGFVYLGSSNGNIYARPTAGP